MAPTRASPREELRAERVARELGRLPAAGGLPGWRRSRDRDRVGVPAGADHERDRRQHQGGQDAQTAEHDDELPGGTRDLLVEDLLVGLAAGLGLIGPANIIVVHARLVSGHGSTRPTVRQTAVHALRPDRTKTALAALRRMRRLLLGRTISGSAARCQRRAEHSRAATSRRTAKCASMRPGSNLSSAARSRAKRTRAAPSRLAVWIRWSVSSDGGGDGPDRAAS